MTVTRRKQIVWWLRGAALAALLAYLPGYLSSRSGGLVEVERLLNHPVLLLGSAVVLLVLSMVIRFEFRTRWAQIGFAAVLSPLIVIGIAIGSLSYVLGGDGRLVARKPGPDRPDHVLTVTDIAFSIDPIYRVELLTGTGWSARHWSLGTWEENDGFLKAEWTGPGRIAVTAEHETRVYTVDGDGRPAGPEVTRR
ncbi:MULTISPECIES: hypothetical protein [Streptomyces]|uniref:hypothetical protein n=1 Tax=Streptomyces TaxID=1883 RepID=UPI0004AAC27A|nr:MULTISPECIES: hypothetical protein [Streptomyces]